MQIEAKVIPVQGIAEVPDIVEGHEEAEARRHRAELLLLNVATALAIALVTSAWVAIALE
jgi:hypothetical protein